MFKKLLVLLVLGAMVLTTGLSTLTAQDDAWTCDEGPNDILTAAQAAHDDRDLETAYELAVQAQIVCIPDHERSMAALALVDRLEIRLGTLDMVDMQPGFVDLGDIKLFMHCMGEGSPTVIFEHGYSFNLRFDAADEWLPVQPPISTVTRTCRYARRGAPQSAGFSRIDRDEVRTTQDQIVDLMLLLEATEIEPPYVFVAHSYAGWLALLFTDQHPDWVQGVVLIDAIHPDHLAQVMLPQNPDYCAEADTSIDNDYERVSFCDSSPQVEPVRSFGDRPLVVVTAGIIDDDVVALWNPLQDDYATFSTNTRHVIAEHGTHNVIADYDWDSIIRDEPELVIEAVLWVIHEVRGADAD